MCKFLNSTNFFTIDQFPFCALCEMIADQEQYTINGKKVRPVSGTCSTYNLIYCFFCTLCHKPYVGRTVQKLNSRCNGHRAAYYKVLNLSKLPNFDIYIH